ncbi:MAG: TolC family protein [Planctomycetota bacterium]|nr:TolC family protein [Planctomycetota bacterium]
MKPVNFDGEPRRERPEFIIPATLIIVGIAASLSATGCQTSRANRLSQAPSGISSTPATAGDTAVAEARTVAFNQAQSADSEESALIEPPSPVVAAPEVIYSESVSSEPFEIIDGGLPLASTDYPIDLMTAMRLAGANHLQIALATERIREASARLEQAEVMWVPNLNLGVGYNRHDGPIQDASGNVIDVSRQSLYFGGGAGVGGSPLTGASNGPARLFVDLSTADVYFEPLAARQNFAATQHAHRVAENDNVLQVGLAYQELVRAQLQIDIAQEAIHNAEELVDLTQVFEEAGKGLAADTQRARAELQQRRHQLAGARERVAVNSAELVRLLRLEQSTHLVAVDPQPLPMELIAADTPIESLVAQGMSHRPELAQHQARVAETMTRISQEQWRPWLPHLHLGYAGAGFGGGRNSDLQNFGARGDFDALAVWQVQNFGLGNRARQNERFSQHQQAHLQYEWIRDQVIAEVTQAYSRARYRKEQIEFAEQQVAVAADALPLNLKGIRDGVIRPIEAQQAIAGLAAARSLYLASVVDFNRAQLELIRALGEPPQNAM